MKASELRVGNWLLFRNMIQPERYVQVDAWFLRQLVNDINDKNPTLNEYYQPIPLSPDILEKAGFYQLPHFTVQNSWIISIGRDRFITVACVGTPNEMVFLTEEVPPEVKAVIVIRNYDYDGKTYLHDIQNIYKDFTKQELTITL